MGENQIYMRLYFGHPENEKNIYTYIYLINHSIADVHCAEDCCEEGIDLLWTGELEKMWADFWITDKRCRLSEVAWSCMTVKGFDFLLSQLQSPLKKPDWGS